MPELLAGEIVGHDTGRGELSVDRSAVGDRRRGAGGILLVRGLSGGTGNLLLPEFLAVGAIERDDRAAFAAVERLRDEHMIAPDDGRRVARFGQGDLPAYVERVAPGGRQAAFSADAVPART